jgi:hypothetical protein
MSNFKWRFLSLFNLLKLSANYSAFGKSLCTYVRCWSDVYERLYRPEPELNNETSAHFNGTFDTDNQIYIP